MVAVKRRRPPAVGLLAHKLAVGWNETHQELSREALKRFSGVCQTWQTHVAVQPTSRHEYRIMYARPTSGPRDEIETVPPLGPAATRRTVWRIGPQPEEPRDCQTPPRPARRRP